MKRLLLFVLIALTAAGCAVNTRYVQYTDQRFAPKPKYAFVTVYQAGQHPPATEPYYVIGRVDLSGHPSDGVTPEGLTDQAKVIARKKGADAIIDLKVQAVDYGGTYAVVTRGGYRYHRYRSVEYVPYADQVITLTGKLIVFTQPAQ